MRYELFCLTYRYFFVMWFLTCITIIFNFRYFHCFCVRISLIFEFRVLWNYLLKYFLQFDHKRNWLIFQHHIGWSLFFHIWNNSKLLQEKLFRWNVHQSFLFPFQSHIQNNPNQSILFLSFNTRSQAHSLWPIKSSIFENDSPQTQVYGGFRLIFITMYAHYSIYYCRYGSAL